MDIYQGTTTLIYECPDRVGTGGCERPLWRILSGKDRPITLQIDHALITAGKCSTQVALRAVQCRRAFIFITAGFHGGIREHSRVSALSQCSKAGLTLEKQEGQTHENRKGSRSYNRPVTDLKSYSRNPKRHPEQQLHQLEQSIKAFGCINPLIVDDDLVIVAGHARFEALKSLRYDKVPIIRVNHLSQDQLRAYRLADNRLAELGEWDESLLRLELEHLARIDIDVDVDLSGFSGPEIDVLLAPDESEFDDPPVPALAENTPIISRIGDVWQLGPHRVVCGDVRDTDLPLDNWSI